MNSDEATHRWGKALATVTALVAWVSLATQVKVAFANLDLLGGTPGLAIWRLLGFFTILTNFLIALAMTIRASGRWPHNWPDERHVLGALTVSIALVGAVYHAVLAKLWNPVGLHWWSDQGLHTGVPMLFGLYWFAFAPKSGLRWFDTLQWMLYPSAYAMYALTRGALDGWYPYPFIDVGKLGYPAVLANVAGLALAVGFGASVLIGYARWQDRHLV
ncbi:MAG TPA: Pr6Pr family membrane protein [Rhabdaerophilum sp.]|nr:Pr6Pr family membrane protein [Rhabdaerophilum sp.]